MLTDTKKMLDKARDGGYAVGAFNAENAENCLPPFAGVWSGICFSGKMLFVGC